MDYCYCYYYYSPIAQSLAQYDHAIVDNLGGNFRCLRLRRKNEANGEAGAVGNRGRNVTGRRLGYKTGSGLNVGQEETVL